ncbi:MAG: endopeptidase La [Desulfobacterales bacterium C00003106]|nr:MAG: endopeptidase La [Desulfobacterales bacterium C00003106]
MAQTDQQNIVSLVEEDGEQIEIPDSVPMVPVRDIVVFPYMIIPLFVGRDKSVRAVDAAMANNRLIMLVTQKTLSEEYPAPADMYDVGTVSIIVRMLKLPDGRVKILIQGLEKRRIVKYKAFKSLFRVKIEPFPDKTVKKTTVRTEALMRSVCEKSEKLLSFRGELGFDVGAIFSSIADPGRLADIVSSNLRLKIPEAQSILMTNDPRKRLKRVHEHLDRELRVTTIQANIQSKAHDEISKTQREYVLKEQLRAIQNELGGSDGRTEEISEYKKKIQEAKMPKEAEKEALKQLKRLDQMHPDSAEVSVVRPYLEWLIEIPWKKSTKDLLDVKKAKEVLDEDHYNLSEVKERILEYLSVRKLNKQMKGPILCFVGPPGVGKTSLGRSIARAMNRKFNRISLGGVRDEAEIRGHRRTYIGAMPGRIIQGLKRCETNNPVFMMDEVDKIGTDFRGDPGSALLEVLDPEQNSAFSDHYINIPFDLSKVLFITTANTVGPIPSALRDRMEIIEIAGYTQEEKAIIADRFLLPRQIKDNGLKPENIDFSEHTLHKIISEYTQEAGLRNLEREIGKICRKTARRIAEGEKGPFRIMVSSLRSLLGVAKYLPDLEQDVHEVGVATGLAWTEFGGEVLYVEATGVNGKGDLMLTGQLGDVMRESAQAGLTYARSHVRDLGIDEDFYKNLDIHIHVPSGAIPKDGPSAGITMATALISALTGKRIDRNVAMTGEITLRGRVLPVGGLKEKVLAALRTGITTLIIPEKNKKDLTEIPKNLIRKIRIVPIKHMDEVLKAVLLTESD